jgi:hypothetical protein
MHRDNLTPQQLGQNDHTTGSRDDYSIVQKNLSSIGGEGRGGEDSVVRSVVDHILTQTSREYRLPFLVIFRIINDAAYDISS